MSSSILPVFTQHTPYVYTGSSAIQHVKFNPDNILQRQLRLSFLQQLYWVAIDIRRLFDIVGTGTNASFHVWW